MYYSDNLPFFHFSEKFDFSRVLQLEIRAEAIGIGIKAGCSLNTISLGP